MLFSSIPFLYYFLPAVLILYFLVPKSFRNTVLLVSSLLFYGWGEPKYVFLMIFSIGLFFGCGLAIGNSRTEKQKKFWLLVSVVCSLTLLGIFKYADFFISSFNQTTGLSVPLLRLALPIGISFYTFQCLSYTIDVYRGNVEPQKNPISFGAYVSLFPQLIAGPIVRYIDVARELDNRQTTAEDLAYGLRRFLIGLGKKVLIANQFGQLIEIFRSASEPSVLFYWMYAVGFMLHIYFDFSGYSDMAIGLGQMFGFTFLENFNYPYISKSVTEFWRRWHMSLGSWFRSYVYIPLGGNRVSKGNLLRNIFVVWLLTGFWHGAAWNFIVWGLIFAVLLVIKKYWLLGIFEKSKVLSRVYTLFFVVISFVIFNANGLSGAASDIGGMFGAGGLPFVSGQTPYYLRSYGLLILAAIVGSMPVLKNLYAKLADKRIMTVLEPVALCAVMVVVTAYLVDGSFNPFLYFRF